MLLGNLPDNMKIPHPHLLWRPQTPSSCVVSEPPAACESLCSKKQDPEPSPPNEHTQTHTNRPSALFSFQLYHNFFFLMTAAVFLVFVFWSFLNVLFICSVCSFYCLSLKMFVDNLHKVMNTSHNMTPESLRPHRRTFWVSYILYFILLN